MIKEIAVLGAGTMGHGIAEFFAMNGYPVNLYEPYEPMRLSCMDAIRGELEFLAENDLIKPEDVQASLDRITVFADLAPAVKDADYIIEATREDLALKQDLFEELEKLTKPEAVLASNTSSLSLSEMIAKVGQKKNRRNVWCVTGTIRRTLCLLLSCLSSEIWTKKPFNEVRELYKKTGKQTCKVKKDVPGMVANRIQQGVAREAFSLMEMDIADPEDIETALKFGPAFRYATTGQLEVADMGGLDIWCTVGDNLLSVMDNSRKANPILRKKVEEGKLGMKNGEGFFKYPAEEVQERKMPSIKN